MAPSPGAATAASCRQLPTARSDYGIIIDFMPLNAAADGSPMAFVFPDEGVTAVTEPVAILSTRATSRRRRPSSTGSFPRRASASMSSRAICRCATGSPSRDLPGCGDQHHAGRSGAAARADRGDQAPLRRSFRRLMAARPRAPSPSRRLAPALSTEVLLLAALGLYVLGLCVWPLMRLLALVWSRTG
jgi:hypothetical protein